MKNTCDLLQKQPENITVLDYLAGQNAHSDLAYFFFERLKDLNKTNIYTPDNYPFPYTLVHANNSIFGFCIGQLAY